MKLFRTIRFDQSDDRVFDPAAGPDEWAISGAFAFSALEPGAIRGKAKQAFSNGFLSLESFGRATFVSVAEIAGGTRSGLVDALADHFVTRYGAPDREAARPVAEAEIGFAADLAGEAPINTVFTVRRVVDDSGEIREEFRTVTPPSEPMHTRIWDVVDD